MLMLHPPLTSYKASGIELVEDHANDIIRWYAERGDVSGCEQFLQTFIKGAAKCAYLSYSHLLSLKVHSPTTSAIYTSRLTKRASLLALSPTTPSHFCTLTKTQGGQHP